MSTAGVLAGISGPTARTDTAIQLFSTCPWSAATPENYRNRVAQVAQWSEAAGCTGILVYTDNSAVDPWLVAQIVIENTSALCPLIAVQPVYMHPYSVAKMVSSLAFLYRRRVFLNMVAGGFKNDLAALNDTTPHDARYERLVEYTQIIRQLVENPLPLTFEGRFYSVKNLSLRPLVPLALQPGILASGSSEAGLAAARQMGAIAVHYPEPPDRTQAETTSGGESRSGIRIGIIAREREEDAWQIALQRFPEDRKGQLTRQLATKISDSEWHHRLAELGDRAGKPETYWLRPFENYQTNCPYLVGSYERVACELARYINLGHLTFILDIPPEQEELQHVGVVFQFAQRGVLP